MNTTTAFRGRAGGFTTLLVAFATVLGVNGCVSSAGPDGSPSEAARYNMQLGVGYLRQNNLEAAKERLERAIRQDPQLATAHSALGVVFERLDDPAGAERHHRRAANLEPKDPDILNGLAVFLCASGRRPAEALDVFDQALAIPLSRKVVNRAVLYTNAGTCARRQDLARAEGYLRQALAHDANYSDALLVLADVSLEQGNALQARGFLERYLDAGPATPGALWLGVRIERALNDRAAANDYARRLREEFPATPEAGRLHDEAQGRG